MSDNESMKERVSLGSRPPGVPGPQAMQVPVDSVTLPSRGLVYPVGTSLHRKEALDVRSMTARDEDILTSRALLKQGRAMTALMQSCLMDKSIDPDQMLVGDRNAVLMAIRASSYGSDYKVTVVCPDCGEQFENRFDLGKLEVHFLGAEPQQEGTNLFEFRLPASGRLVVFKLLTGAEEREIAEMQERKKKKIGGLMTENNVTAKLFNQIVSIDGDTDRGRISAAVRDMPARDSLELRRHIDTISPYVDMVQPVECPHCGTSSEVDMPVGAEFFWPSTR